MKLSAIILAKNEEKNISGCIDSLGFTDEVIVIDDCSTDKTAAVARRKGVTVITRKLGDFASRRNFGLSKAHGEWVLFVDADERISPKLAQEITSAVS